MQTSVCPSDVVAVVRKTPAGSGGYTESVVYTTSTELAYVSQNIPALGDGESLEVRVNGETKVGPVTR